MAKMISEPFLKIEDELAAVLKKLSDIVHGEKDLESSRFYYSLTGNLSLISKHRQDLKLKKVEDLSIPDLERLINIMSYFKIYDNSMKEKLSRLLDKKFRKICGSNSLIRIDYYSLRWFNPYLSPRCDTEMLYHYIVAKEILNELEELKNDEKLVFISRKTYDLEKINWFKEKSLRTSHNKWVHFISAINRLGILDEEEKKAILKHNAELKLNKRQPLLAQLWNRIWLFRGLGITNIEHLRHIFPSEREFLEMKNNVCGLLPKTLNFAEEDIFTEGSNLMRSKYNSIKEFCNVK